MAWKFWRSGPDKTEAERSLEQLEAPAAPKVDLGDWKPEDVPPPPVPDVSADGSFVMVVADVFSITGRGTVVTGQVAGGSLDVGRSVTFVDAAGRTRTVPVTGIEAFRKRLDTATAGQNVGLLLKGVDRADIVAGTELRG